MQVIDLTAPGGKRNTYRYPDNLSEISLLRMIEYQEQVESLKPETLFKAETANMTPAEALEYIGKQSAEERLEWLSHYAKQVAYWCDMPASVAAAIKIADLMALRSRLMDIIKLKGFEYNDNLFEFEINGEKFSLAERYMKGAQLIDFVEAMEYEHIYEKSLAELDETEAYKKYIDRLKTNEYRVLPKIMALVCRRLINGAREDYHDQIVEENESKFLSVNCAIAFNVAFFLLRRKQKFMSDFQTLPILPQWTPSKPELMSSPGNTVGTESLRPLETEELLGYTGQT